MFETNALDSVGNAYVDKNIGSGTPGTRLEAADRNIIQDELVSAVELTGQTLDPAGVLREQLATAIFVNGNLPTVSDLETVLYTPFDGQIAYVSGFLAATELQPWQFSWNASSTATPISGMIVAVVAIVTGRWERVFDVGEVSASWFGAVDDDTIDSHTAIQAAIDYGGTILDTDGSYNRVVGTVILPGGAYLVGSGKTLRLIKGLHFKGSGRTITTLNHGGGGVPLFDTDTGSVTNYEWVISDISLIGSGVASTYCVIGNNCNRNNSISRVNIRNFNVSLNFTDTWTFAIEDCDIFGAIDNNIEWFNATDLLIENSRIWGAGGHNIYIDKSTSFQSVNVNLTNTYVSSCQKAGIFLRDVINFNLIGGSFESCNKEDGDWGYIHQITGPSVIGELFTLTNVYATSTNGSASSKFLHASKGKFLLNACRTTNTGTGGGFFEYVIYLASASVEHCIMNSCDFEGAVVAELFRIDSTIKVYYTPEKILTISASDDNLDVTGITTIFCNTGAADVVIGGLTGGFQGQRITFIKTVNSNNMISEHNEGIGDQQIFNNGLVDVSVPGYGGLDYVCNGSTWYQIQN